MPRVMHTNESSCEESSERLERFLDVAKRGPRDETSAKSLLCGVPQQIGRQTFTSAVVQRPPGCGHRYRAEPGAISFRQVRVVEHDARGHTETSRAPLPRKRDVDLRREHIGEPEERQSRVVREHACLSGPQPRHHQLLVRARRKVYKPVDAAACPEHTSSTYVVHQELRGEPRFGCLPRCEHPFLGRRHLEEAIPLRTVHGRSNHARNVKPTLVSCKHRCTKLK